MRKKINRIWAHPDGFTIIAIVGILLGIGLGFVGWVWFIALCMNVARGWGWA